MQYHEGANFEGTEALEVLDGSAGSVLPNEEERSVVVMQQGELNTVANVVTCLGCSSGRSTNAAPKGNGTFGIPAQPAIRPRQPLPTAFFFRTPRKKHENGCSGPNVQRVNINPQFPPHIVVPPSLLGLALSLAGGFRPECWDQETLIKEQQCDLWRAGSRSPLRSACCATPRFDKTHPLPLLL